jgi:hypothetical protein
MINNIMIYYIIVFREEVPHHERGYPGSLAVLTSKGGPVRMPAIAFVLAGFMAAVFVMTVISLYKYVAKIISL